MNQKSHIYIHLSDIHFGQEKDGGQVVVNNDVKEQLIMDARSVVNALPGGLANGIIISGDVAYAGKKEEYDSAWNWLRGLTGAVGCEQTAVQVVPGNHDIDRSLISHGTQLIIDDIIKRGDEGLNSYLSSEEDREILYRRFSDYRTFADSYNCPLDGEGTIKGHRTIEIAPGKFLKFHGINTALICSKSKIEEGSLLLGQRQRVIPGHENTEIVIIAHHPLHWLQDSEDALHYIKNRARIFISGHEHIPSNKLTPVEKNGSQLLSIASGATVPPKETDTYKYCYNILQFSWDTDKELLIVNIHARTWDKETLSFIQDTVNYRPDNSSFALKCPNYTNSTKANVGDKKNMQKATHEIAVPTDGLQDSRTMSEKTDQQLLLKFFRDLTSAQRLSILIKMGVFPANVTDKIKHTLETTALKSIFASGRSEELNQFINEILSPKIEGND